MKRKLISMRCRYIMGHPEIKGKIPVRLYREGDDIVIADRTRVVRGKIPLDRIMNLSMESKANLQIYIAKAMVGTLRNPGFLGEKGEINLKDQMLLIDWLLPNNSLITTVFEYCGFLGRLKAEVADSEFRKIMREISLKE